MYANYGIARARLRVCSGQRRGAGASAQIAPSARLTGSIAGLTCARASACIRVREGNACLRACVSGYKEMLRWKVYGRLERDDGRAAGD